MVAQARGAVAVAGVVAAGLLMTLMTGCDSSGGAGGAGGSGSGSGGSASSPPSSPPSGTPSGTATAGSSAVRDCYDGSCTLVVRTHMKVPLDGQLGVRAIEFVSLLAEGGAQIRTTGDDGSGFDLSGASSDHTANFSADRLSITLKDISDGRAVATFSPGKGS